MGEGTLRGVADPGAIRVEVRRLLEALLSQVDTGLMGPRSGFARGVDLLRALAEDMHPSSGLATEQLLQLSHDDGSPILDGSFVSNSAGQVFAYLSRSDDAAEQREVISEFAASHGLSVAAFVDESEASPKDQFSLDMVLKGIGAGFEHARDEAWDVDGAVIVRRLADLGNNLETVLWNIAETQGDQGPPILTAVEGLDTSSAGGCSFARAVQFVLDEERRVGKQEVDRDLSLRAQYRAELGGEDQILNDLAAGKDVPSFEVWKRWRAR